MGQRPVLVQPLEQTLVPILLYRHMSCIRLEPNRRMSCIPKVHMSRSLMLYHSCSCT